MKKQALLTLVAVSVIVGCPVVAIADDGHQLQNHIESRAWISRFDGNMSSNRPSMRFQGDSQAAVERNFSGANAKSQQDKDKCYRTYCK